MRVDVVADVTGGLAPTEQAGQRVGQVLVDLAEGLAEVGVVGQGGGVGDASCKAGRARAPPV